MNIAIQDIQDNDLDVIILNTIKKEFASAAQKKLREKKW